MRTLPYAEFRANDAQVFDDVVNNCEEVVITRPGHEPVVMVSLADYESLQETTYLLHSPANAHRLFNSIDNLEAGRGTRHHLTED